MSENLNQNPENDNRNDTTEQNSSLGNDKNDTNNTSDTNQSAPSQEQIPTETQSSCGSYGADFGYHSSNIRSERLNEKKKNWIFESSVDVPKDYNPYRRDLSVFNEIYTENPKAFEGNTPKNGESSFEYTQRINSEWIYARKKAAQKIKKDSSFVSLIILLYLLLTNSLVIILSVFIQNNSPIDIQTLNNVIMILQYALIFPCILLVANIGNKHKCRTFFRKPQVSKFYILRWCIISIGLVYIVAILGNIFFAVIESMGVYVADLSSDVPTSPIDIIIYFLAVVIGAPIFEELMFRGVFLTRNLKHGAFYSATMSAIFFGLLHQNHEQIFYAAVLGFVFAFIDIKAGSIIPSIIAHVAVNLYSFLITLTLSFTNYNDIRLDPTAQLDGPALALFCYGILDAFIYIAMGLAIILFIYEYTTNKKHFTLTNSDKLLLSGEKFNLSVFTGATIAALIVLLSLTALNSFVNLDAITEMINNFVP